MPTLLLNNDETVSLVAGDAQEIYVDITSTGGEVDIRAVSGRVNLLDFDGSNVGSVDIHKPEDGPDAFLKAMRESAVEKNAAKAPVPDSFTKAVSEAMPNTLPPNLSDKPFDLTLDIRFGGTDRNGYIEEAANQFGFDYTDDDADHMACSTHQLHALVRYEQNVSFRLGYNLATWGLKLDVLPAPEEYAATPLVRNVELWIGWMEKALVEPKQADKLVKTVIGYLQELLPKEEKKS